MLPSLARRGPSRQGWFERDSRRGGEDGDRIFSLAMHAAVLHLRGEEICQQPAVDDGGNALCWNGEVFGGVVRHLISLSLHLICSRRLAIHMPQT